MCKGMFPTTDDYNLCRSADTVHYFAELPNRRRTMKNAPAATVASPTGANIQNFQPHLFFVVSYVPSNASFVFVSTSVRVFAM